MPLLTPVIQPLGYAPLSGVHGGGGAGGDTEPLRTADFLQRESQGDVGLFSAKVKVILLQRHDVPLLGSNECVMATSDEWLAKLARLKVDKARGDPAPHKPLLLLVVLELAEQGTLPKDVLPLTPELAFRFCTYWSVVASQRTRKPDVEDNFGRFHEIPAIERAHTIEDRSMRPMHPVSAHHDGPSNVL